MESERVNTLDKYLINYFIDKASEEHSIPKQKLLNTWYSVNGSFSLSHVSEDNENDDFITKEVTYSYDSVFGCETERDGDVRNRIINDIKANIEKYMNQNYPEYRLSTVALFDGKNFEVEIEDENANLYINGPEKEISCIITQLDSQVLNLYSCKQSVLGILNKYFWL